MAWQDAHRRGVAELERLERELADERAAHAVTQAERNEARRVSEVLRRFQVAVCAMVDRGVAVTRSDLIAALKP